MTSTLPTRPQPEREPTESQPAGSPRTPTELAADPGRGAWARWRPLLLRWHFYAGLLVGPFMLLAAVTGLAYTLVPQVDQAIFSHELNVDHVGAQRLPIDQQVAAARAAHPEGTLAKVVPASSPDGTTRVSISTPDVPEGKTRTVFVDPYDAKIQGTLTTMGEWLPVRTWFDDLHRNLHLGVVGRNYSELAASWLWVISLGGLVLWVGYRRRTGKLRRVASPDRKAPRRKRTLSWHGAVGVWVVVGLLALAASGLSWSKYTGAHISDLRTAMSWTSPSVSTTVSPRAEGAVAPPGSDATPSGAAEYAGIDKALRAANAAGMQGPMNLTPPEKAGEAWTVATNKRNWLIDQDSISVDPTTGHIVDRVNFAQWPFMAKLTEYAISAHMGILFGIANQVVLGLLAIGLISIIVRGYLMWWRRRPTRSSGSRASGSAPSGTAGSTDRALPTAPRRGALGSLRPVEAAVLVAVIAVVGWFIPLLGIPLAGFVLVDVVLGMRGGRRVGAVS